MKPTLTQDEILEAERAADERTSNRSAGFAKMKERDAAGARLSNGVLMRWHVPVPEIKTELVPYPLGPPPGSFILEVGDEKIIFNTEEFRKHLRWA